MWSMWSIWSIWTVWYYYCKINFFSNICKNIFFGKTRKYQSAEDIELLRIQEMVNQNIEDYSKPPFGDLDDSEPETAAPDPQPEDVKPVPTSRKRASSSGSTSKRSLSSSKERHISSPREENDNRDRISLRVFISRTSHQKMRLLLCLDERLSQSQLIETLIDKAFSESESELASLISPGRR